MKPLSLCSLLINKRLAAVISIFKNQFCRGFPPLIPHPLQGRLRIRALSPTPHGTQEYPWPAGTSGPAALAEDKSEAQDPVRILTVGQSDHAQDAGETAAGGGAQPSGQDLRATMQRKGEPCGGSVTPPKLSSRFSDAPLWGTWPW